MRDLPLRAALAGMLSALAAVTGAAETPPLPDFEVADRLMPADPLPERRTDWSNGAVTLTDVVYATIPGFRPLHLDLYRPADGHLARPLIVFVHGGGWAHANPRASAAFRNLPSLLAHLVQRGYVVASVEFRFSEEAPFPAQLEDLQAAMRFLRSNASRYGIDGTKVALWGMSSGAHLAAMNAVKCAEGTCVQAFAGWFGPYDLATYQHETSRGVSVEPLLGCGERDCTPEALEAASPIRHLDDHDPPVLLIHGAEDNDVLPVQSVRFAERLRSAGASVDLLLIPGVRHGFIGATDGATKDASRRALAATFDFFDRVLKSAPAGADR